MMEGEYMTQTLLTLRGNLRPQLTPTTDDNAVTKLFSLPTDSLGVLGTISGNTFWTAPWGEPIYSCPNSGCGGSIEQYQPLCLELVEVGGTPTACLAQIRNKIERNPTLLYAVSKDGKFAAYTRKEIDGRLLLDADPTSATTFFVPGLNNGSALQDTYAQHGIAYGKIWGAPEE
jgi:hypothetical protein